MGFIFIISAVFGIVAGKNVIEILKNNSDTEGIYGLITRANLVEQLKGDEFTIFAPSNKALEDLPKSTLTAYVTDTDKLTDFLRKHTVYGRVSLENATNDDQYLNGAGNLLRFNRYDHNRITTIQGIKIVDEITTDGGVVYILDQVLPPIPEKNIMEVVATDPNFSRAFQFMKSSGVDHYLNGDHMTVFVPTNDGFEALGHALEKHLTLPLLKEILEYHIVDRTLYTIGMFNNQQLQSLSQHHDLIHIRKSPDGYIRANYAHITKPDIQASNGVLHGINFLLIEPRYLVSILAG